MSTVGTILPSQAGIHHAHRPSRVSTAGASINTIVAASSTAVDRPTPNCLTTGSPFRMKLENTEIMIRAAAEITRALVFSPSRTEVRSSSPCRRWWSTEDSRNTW